MYEYRSLYITIYTKYKLYILYINHCHIYVHCCYLYSCLFITAVPDEETNRTRKFVNLKITVFLKMCQTFYNYLIYIHSSLPSIISHLISMTVD